MRDYFISALISTCAGILMGSSGLANAISSDVSGVSVRLDSALFPIPPGFVLESVNVREIDGEEVEELRFISKKEDSILRSIDVYRRRSLLQSTSFQLEDLLHFGDQATMTECSSGPFKVLRADYQGLTAYTKVAIMRDSYQVLLIGEGSPRAAIAILKGIEDLKTDSEPREHLDQLTMCLIEVD